MAAPPRGGTVTLSLTAIAVAAVAVVMAAAALWPGRGEPGPAPAAAAVAPNGQVRTFSVELGDLFVRPLSVSVPYGTQVVLHVVNDGAMSHDLQLEGGSTGTGMLAPGRPGRSATGPSAAPGRHGAPSRPASPRTCGRSTGRGQGLCCAGTSGMSSS